MVNQINVVVRDMEAAVAFYRLLGLTVSDSAPPWDRHHREATSPGGPAIELDSEESARMWNRGWSGGGQGGGVVINFGVASSEEVDSVYARLSAAGYRSQQEPYDAFWGGRYAIVEDPDGNAIGLMGPIDRSKATMPPDPSGGH